MNELNRLSRSNIMSCHKNQEMKSELTQNLLQLANHCSLRSSRQSPPPEWLRVPRSTSHSPFLLPLLPATPPMPPAPSATPSMPPVLPATPLVPPAPPATVQFATSSLPSNSSFQRPQNPSLSSEPSLSSFDLLKRSRHKERRTSPQEPMTKEDENVKNFVNDTIA